MPDLLTPAAIDGLRKLVLNVTLPAALFLAFLRTEMEAQYAVIVISVFGACLVVLAVGPWLRRGAGVSSQAMPSLMAGFEAGMIGYALYTAIFGAEHLYRFRLEILRGEIDAAVVHKARDTLAVDDTELDLVAAEAVDDAGQVQAPAGLAAVGVVAGRAPGFEL